MRPFLFLAGEYAVTQPAVFQRDNWSHTMTSRPLQWARDSITGSLLGRVERKGCESQQEDLKGFVYFNRAEDVLVERANLNFIRLSRRPCWPNVYTLLKLSSRHDTLRICRDAGFVDHPVRFVTEGEALTCEDWPFVLKIGESHCGEDKYLIRSRDEVPHFEGTATLEPFFEGESCRILLLGPQAFGVKYWNDQSWIKNAAGADCKVWNDWPSEMEAHARNVAKLCDLEIAGVDYIIEPSGKFHFLEINQYPGLNISEESAEAARKFLHARMQWVEDEAIRKGLMT